MDGSCVEDKGKKDAFESTERIQRRKKTEYVKMQELEKVDICLKAED